jgi:hypothetical protein
MTKLYGTLYSRGGGQWKLRDTGLTEEDVREMLAHEGWQRDLNGRETEQELARVEGQYRIKYLHWHFLRVGLDRYVETEE